MRFRYSFYVLFVLSFCVSCSYRQSQALFENKGATTVLRDTSAASKFPVKSTYRIQPRDILQIRNLQNIKYIVDDVAPSTSGVSGSGTAGLGQTFEVDEDGTVALPALGHIAVGGLTRAEATRKIEGLYRKELLKDPIIELKITNLKVTIFGESVAQGNFPLLKDNTTLVEIIGQAGGLTKNANEKNVKIIRGTGTNKSVTEIDLSDISSISDPRAILQNGDIIYIAQNRHAIRNDKLQNINTYAQPVTLLLSTALIIYSLSRQ